MKLSRCHQTYCGDHRNMGTAHPTGPKCPHSKVTGWYIHKCPKVKTFAISSELLIGVRALKLFSKQKHMWTYREEMDSGTWPAPVQMCTLGDMPSKASSQLSLASLISHLPQTLWGWAGSCGFCYAFVLSNLICFVFCCVPLERVKMLPHCGRTVLLYALTVMRQPGRLKRSHPVPYPRWREKKKKQKTKKCPDRAGFVHEPRVEPGLERIPLFWGCVMSRFWRFISKVRKAVLLKGGWRLQLFFKHMQKWTNRHIRVQWSEGLDHLPDGSCLPSVGLGTSFKFGMGPRWETNFRCLSFSYWQQGRHRLQIIHAASCRIIKSGEKCSLSWRCLFPKNEGIYFFKEKGQNLRANQMKVNLSGEPGRWAV